MNIYEAINIIKSVPSDQAVQFLKAKLSGRPVTSVIPGELIVVYVVPDDDIKKIAMDIFGVETLSPESPSRRVTMARHCVLWFKKRHDKLSYAAAGTIFGQDHATVYYAVKHVEAILFTKDPLYYKEVKQFIDTVSSYFENS